jgi:hypothetical protein
MKTKLLYLIFVLSILSIGLVHAETIVENATYVNCKSNHQSAGNQPSSTIDAWDTYLGTKRCLRYNFDNVWGGGLAYCDYYTGTGYCTYQERYAINITENFNYANLKINGITSNDCPMWIHQLSTGVGWTLLQTETDGGNHNFTVPLNLSIAKVNATHTEFDVFVRLIYKSGTCVGYFTESQLIYGCNPTWECTSLQCNPSTDQTYCLEVNDTSSCDESYTGDYSEFIESCDARYSTSEVALLPLDIIGTGLKEVKNNMAMLILGGSAIIISLGLGMIFV